MQSNTSLTTTPQPVPVTVLAGDGIGPEIMQATLRVLAAAGADLAVETCVAGGEAFAAGVVTGVPAATIDSIRRTGLVLKGPLGTPIGEGGRSANVTLRNLFETYGNIRPAFELPGVTTLFSGRGVDFVVVRENVEDVYAGIEHTQSPGVHQALKVITDRGCERVCRLAFEVAKAEGRSRVTCVTKANILKLTEGALKRAFERVATEYPGIKADHMLVDACAHDMVRYPERFDVIVCTNLHGDILSDLAAGLVGGLGLASSSNVGDNAAIFEAVHGTAPDIAGKDIANPTALILAGASLLRYIGEAHRAESIERGVTAALAAGIRTADLSGSAQSVGTEAFADAVIARLGKGQALKNRQEAPVVLPAAPIAEKDVPYLVRGQDVFVEHHGDVKELIALLLRSIDLETCELKLVTNRGAMVWPVCADADLCPVFRVRVLYLKDGAPQASDVLEAAGLAVCHTERLISINGRDEFSA